jgi:hypothetical protein
MPPVARIPAAAMIDAIKGGNIPWWLPESYKQLFTVHNIDFDYFVYGCTYEPLNANATTQRNIAISGDADFCILSAVLVETAEDNTTFVVNSPILFTLKDSGSGRELSNEATHADNWFGTAQLPKYWDVPKILTRNSTFTVTAQNLEATARNVRVSFHGFKIFPFTQ